MNQNGSVNEQRPCGYRHWCCVMPWVPILGVVLMATGIPLAYIHSLAAANTTQQLLQDTDIEPATIQQAMRYLLTMHAAVLALALACLATVMLATSLHTYNRAGRKPAGRYYARMGCCLPAVHASTAVLLWVVMLVLLMTLALCVSWLLGAVLVNLVLDEATEYSSFAESAAQRVVRSASSLVDTLKSSQFQELEKAPQDIEQSTWYQGFRANVGNLYNTVSGIAQGGSSSSSGTPCQPGCINLELLATLANVDNCLCITNSLEALQPGVQQINKDLIPTLVGLGLIYLGSSWLFAFFVASYVHARRDQMARKAAAIAPVPAVYSNKC
eukprot:GHRR01012926.1.p1 GENE.GHRR01012926.1~~GHRR01012926.1.p1  ORF type:complete len:328 (+),score=81.14 GHRR01012926.1:304-1287(+)